MREIAQPYHANLNKGGRMFARWAGLEDQNALHLNQGDSDKQIALMRSILATNPKCTVFNVEPQKLPALSPVDGISQIAEPKGDAVKELVEAPLDQLALLRDAACCGSKSTGW